MSAIHVTVLLHIRVVEDDWNGYTDKELAEHITRNAEQSVQHHSQIAQVGRADLVSYHIVDD